MSMLNLSINRSGRSLPAPDRCRLERAKVELRKAFGRPAAYLSLHPGDVKATA